MSPRLDRNNLLTYRTAAGEIAPVKSIADWQNRRREILRGMQEVMGRYLDALNLPTKTDIDGLGERLHAIEDELSRVSAAIEKLAGSSDGPAGGVPRVARTKRFAPKGEHKA